MNLDIIPNGAIKRVHVSQNDVGRTLTFELFNNSTSYTIPSGATVKIQGTKPSGFGFSETCTVSGNTVTVDTTEEMTDEHGYIDTELQIKYNDNTIGTSNFVLAVERNPHPDTTTDGSMETIIPELTLLVNEVKGYAEEIEGTYHAYGSPWVASTVAEMTDTDKIYVYTGSETGYTNGNWYYYDGSSWVSGSVYNAVAVNIDPTLTIQGACADAKAAGDAINDLKTEVSDINLGDMSLNVIHNERISMGGLIVQNQSGYTRTDYIPVNDLSTLYFTSKNSTATRTAVFFDSSKQFLSQFDIVGNGTTIVTVPTDAVYFMFSDTNDRFYKIKVKSYFKQYIEDNFLEEASTNLFDKSKAETGVQIVATTGATVEREDMSASDYIAVEPNTYYLISNQINQLISHCAFYNLNKTYLTGNANSNLTGKSLIYTPTGTRFLRISMYDNAKDTTMVTKGRHFVPYMAYSKGINQEKLPLYRTSDFVTVGASGCDYTSILQALKSTPASMKVVVTAGIYNVVNEYKAYYGDTWFDDYTGYGGNLDYFYRGYWLEHGRKIHCEVGSKIVFDYNGNNQNVIDNFSPVNMSYDTELIGAYVVIGNNNCRYAVHDDSGYSAGTNVIKNCVFEGSPSASSLIGGGCGLDNMYIIDNCMFLNNNSAYDITYHNALTAGAINRIYVTNCYGTKGCWFRWYGNSTAISLCNVNNSRFGSIGVQAHSSTPNTNVNMQLIEFNNTTV